MNNEEAFGVVLLAAGLILGFSMTLEEAQRYDAIHATPIPTSPFNACLARMCFGLQAYVGAECGVKSAEQASNLRAVSAYCQNVTASGVGS